MDLNWMSCLDFVHCIFLNHWDQNWWVINVWSQCAVWFLLEFEWCFRYTSVVSVHHQIKTKKKALPMLFRAYTWCIFLFDPEPTHDVYSWPWRDCLWGDQVGVSGGWNKIWLGFEDTSGRSIDGEADQSLISHTHQAGAPHVLQKPVELSADRLVVELMVQKTHKGQWRRDQRRNHLT